MKQRLVKWALEVKLIVVVLVLSACSTQSGGGSGGSQPQVLTRAQASAKVHTELAAQYYERTQYKIALEEINIALNAVSDYAPAYSMRGLIRMALREDQRADEDFKHSLKLNRHDSDTHNNYGWFLCQRGRENESIPHFLDAVKNPLYATPEKAYLNAGICSRKAGNTKAAEEYLRKALALRSDIPDAWLNLAEINFASGNYAVAKTNFQLFMQINSSAATAGNLWMGVHIERKLGDQASEKIYAAQLHKRYPNARETQLLLNGK